RHPPCRASRFPYTTLFRSRLTKAPEWRGLGTYLDLELQQVDGQSYRGRARLNEFLDDPEQRRLFEGLGLGTGDRLEILVKLHRPDRKSTRLNSSHEWISYA